MIEYVGAVQRIHILNMCSLYCLCFALFPKKSQECNRQEDCLALVMEAASQHVVPKQVCALTRKMCGERATW